jgi:hypothetical protein
LLVVVLYVSRTIKSAIRSPKATSHPAKTATKELRPEDDALCAWLVERLNGSA